MSSPAKRRVDRTSPLADRAPLVIRRLKKAYPDAKVALKFSNPLEMLVATVLSAQCTDQKVNEVTANLFKKYRTPEDYLKAREDELKKDIFQTGFYNQKAKAIRGACHVLLEEFGGRIPETMEEIVRLPGVARKTGNIVLGNAYGIVVGIAVDTHVRRVSQRLGFTEQADPDKIERDLMQVISKKDWFSFTYVLIDHGRRICKAPKPLCEECPVNDLCPASRV